MRRIVLSALVICMTMSAFAQTDSAAKKPVKKSAYEVTSGDHLLIQFGWLNWTQTPDSIKTTGFPHSFNVFLMFEFPFKTDPHWSVALGPGIATDHMYFDKMYPGLKDLTSTLYFNDQSDTTHFKKVKLATAYAELPIELRYRFNGNTGMKIALGAKVGALLNAHTRATELQDKADKELNAYVEKESSKRFMNKTRLSVSARIGFGHFSVFTNYSITPLFKEGLGPIVKPFTVGLTLSGL
jgi:hypothetical protein